MQSEGRFTQPRPDCPHPERWHSPDSDSTEIEVSRLVSAFVTALRPDLVVETGTAFGQTAQQIGDVLLGAKNLAEGAYEGKLLTFETDPRRVKTARLNCEGLPVEVREKDSISGLAFLAEEIRAGRRPKIGFAWLDSLFELRAPELRLVTPVLMPGAIVGIHDCGEPGHTKYGPFSRSIAGEARKLGFNRISLPTPRGVTFLQKGHKR